MNNSTLYNSNSEVNTEQNELNNQMNNNFGTRMISFNGWENSDERKYNLMNASNSYNYNMNTQSTDDFDNLNPNKTFIFDSVIDKEKIIKFIDRLEYDLKKEKNRNNKIIGEFNKILLDRKKLEKIFIECFEESRREIFQRKVRDTMQCKGAFFQGVNKSTNIEPSLPMINDIKFENFQHSDKRKLVESFLMSDEVMELIKENLGDVIIENKTSYSKKVNFGETFQNKTGNMKKKNDIKFINELVKNKSVKSKSLNFSMSLMKK